jgi:hypothetical protein
VDVAHAGGYTLNVRVASLEPGGDFHVAVDGRRVTGTLTVPHTDGWQNWTTIHVPRVPLPAGVHTLQLVMVDRGNNGGVGNFNWLSFE